MDDPKKPNPQSPPDLSDVPACQSVAVPVIREEVEVGKQVVERGKVVVHISPQTRTEMIDLPVTEEVADVRRVPVNRIVDAPVGVREEEGVTIIPVYEEVLVVEKRLRLKEEIRITRRRSTRQQTEKVDLRAEVAQVRRVENSR
jgi:stress response protein YsnF